jgi:deoxyribose-phosphate aldolase
MVLNIGALKSGLTGPVGDDIRGVVAAVQSKALVKVILETCFLTDAEKRKACELAQKAGAHFVKTSTGFGPAGANTADVALMRQVVGPDFGVKASGGIRNYETAQAMCLAGANRLGTSNSIAIVRRDK